MEQVTAMSTSALATSDTAADIQWDLQPLDTEPADDDPLTAAVLDADSYRAGFQEALHFIHRLQTTHDRLRDERDRLRTENRWLREQLMAEGVKA